MTITKRGVGGNARINFVPYMLGNSRWGMFQGEAGIQNLFRNMCKDYNGGMWKFVKLSNGGAYMYPDMGKGKIDVVWSDNYYSGEMTPEAAGIAACLMFLSSAAMQRNCQLLADRYHQLREYSYDHPEAKEINKILD